MKTFLRDTFNGAGFETRTRAGWLAIKSENGDGGNSSTHPSKY